MGSVVDAVDRYTDIPADVRARLKQKMARRDYDDIATIGRDSINGKDGYDPEIRDMHFGTDRVCTTVSRSGWSKDRQERGLVYCDGGECIIVPTVCRNVSRVTRHGGGAPIAHAALFAPADAVPTGELVFDAPSAGPLAEPAELFGPIAGGEAGAAAPPSAGTFVGASAGGYGYGPGFIGGGSYGGGGGGGALAVPSAVGSETDSQGSDPSDSGGMPVVTTPVPEPAVWQLSALGLVALALARWSRRRAER